MSTQETDTQGVTVIRRDGAHLTIVDSVGGGQELGQITNREAAQILVSTYISNMADIFAEELMDQFEWDEEEEE